MSIEGFIPEIWSAVILEALEKNLVFAGPGCVNRDYEGEIQEAGDTVKITSISDPTIATYVADSTVIVPEELTDAQRSLLIDQSKYFAFKVDDVKKRQAANGGGVMTVGMKRAAYKLRDVADQYVAGLYADADTDNAITTTAITTPDLALQYLVELGVRLDQKDVPTEERFVILPPWYLGLLRRNPAFTDASASGSTETLRNGIIGRAEGFDVKMSNNVTLVSGDDYRVCAGHPMAISYAEQINKVEAYRPESSFSDAVKGLHLYGAKLVRPNCIATLLASKT